MKRKMIWIMVPLWAGRKAKVLLILALAAGLCIIIPIKTLNAQGLDKPRYFYYNFSFGARALGMSNAFTAGASDLTAVFWNPACLGKLAFPEAMAVYKSDAISGHRENEILNSAINPVSGLADTETYSYTMNSALKNAAFLSASLPLHIWDLKWQFALSYYRLLPYGPEADATGLYRFTGDSRGDHAVNYAYSGSGGPGVIAFSAACVLDESFSLGATYLRFIQSGDGVYTQADADSIDKTTYNDRFEGQSLILGLHFEPAEYFSIGLTYQTAISNRYHLSLRRETFTEDSRGAQTSSSSAAREGDYSMPARLAAGFLLNPFSFLKVSMDYSVIYWDRGRITGYNGDNVPWKFPTMTPLTSGGQGDCINLRLGMEIKFPFDYFTVFLRGGVFNEQPMFRDDTNQWPEIVGYSFGVGVDVASWLAADIGFMKQRSDWRENGVLNPSIPVLYRYDNSIMALSLIFRLASPDLNL